MTGGCFEMASPSDEIIPVFARGQKGRLAVGGLLRQRINRQAADCRFGQRVGVDRQKQLGPVAARPRDALAQLHQNIPAPGQHHPIPAGGLELALQLARHRQRYIFFLDAARTDRAGIDAAMPGIERYRARLAPGL